MATYEFDVKMTCSGCSGAVNRALGKMEGLESYDVNLETQTVTVHPNGATYEEVLAKITKTGKEVRSGKVVDPTKAVEGVEAVEPVEASETNKAQGPPSAVETAA